MFFTLLEIAFYTNQFLHLHFCHVDRISHFNERTEYLIIMSQNVLLSFAFSIKTDCKYAFVIFFVKNILILEKGLNCMRIKL